MDELRILSPTGAFGVTPFNEDSFRRGLARDPHMIGVDAGSDDLGPYGLGADVDINPLSWERRQVELLLTAALQRSIPLVIGSAGHAGTDAGVDRLADLFRAVRDDLGLPAFSMARIYSEVSAAWVEEKIAGGLVRPLPGAPVLTAEMAQSSNHIVGVMGPEPISEALSAGAQVVIAGRAVDEAVFSAFPLLKGFPKGLSEHLGKVLECASLAGEPYMSRSALLGTIRGEELLFEPLHPDQICTPQSVAAHSLYERMDPFRQAGPGGWLDLSATQYDQVDDRVTRVTGSRWEEASSYTAKLEGAEWCGVRRLGIVGLRDRLAIANIPTILEFVRDEVAAVYPDDEFDLFLHPYGVNAIMKDFDPVAKSSGHEICVVVETVASEPELAESVTRLAVRKMFIAQYPGQMSTGGGGAMLTDEVLVGNDAYRWSVHHVTHVSTPREFVTTEIEQER
jgi:hypothetical protein